ncbi:MAG TPA: MBL fold metallo-hydrolase [Acidimicrobiia bacterium]|nr:MBL fold metallo-hydrolase [Acidimicrobiia bacterium]
MSERTLAQDMGQGVSLITLPLPFRAPPSVNAYVIEGGEGLTLIDCGTDWEEGFEALTAGLTALGLDPAGIHTLVVSHLHPDHVGMAPRLARRWGVKIVMHSTAAGLIDRYNDTSGYVRRTREMADRHGVPAAERAAFVDVGVRPDWMPPIDRPDQVVHDGDRIPIGRDRVFEVLHTPGHEPAHICLRDSRTGVLFSGDHILPRITPFVGYDELFEDALGDFLNSLARIEQLAVGLTYPAHGALVEHGSARAEQLLAHHQRRLADMLEVIDPTGASAWEVMEKVFRPNLGPGEQRLALRETIAHLEHLRLQGKLAPLDRDGTRQYRPASAY